MGLAYNKTLLPLLLVSVLFGCGKTTPADVCNPTQGRIIKGTHYVEADLLNENGLWDYSIWLETYLKYNKIGGCIPVQEVVPLSRQIDKIEKTIDLWR